jgi:ribosome-associated protein
MNFFEEGVYSDTLFLIFLVEISVIVMEKITYELNEDFIELIKLLKILQIAQTGGHAKLIVDDELVFRNGEVELRKRAKLVKGDVLLIDNQLEVKIV